MATPKSEKRPIWQIGFRPFFLGASLWAIVSMALWLGLLQYNVRLGLNGMLPAHWHGHEMIYGFAMAVVAGFLLTAVPTWTKTPPVSGWPLITVFAFWFVARGLFLAGNHALLILTAVFDLLFQAGLLILLGVPLFRYGKMRQWSIWIKAGLIVLSNVLFYLGAFGVIEEGIYYGLYSGFYLIIALVLTISRRVIPMFMENGLYLDAPLRNRKWVDVGSLVLVLVFWLVEVFVRIPGLSAGVALLLCIVHLVRLYDWYVPAMWEKPLLWVLYLAYAFIVSGFAFKAVGLTGWSVPPSLVLHLFAIGGIALMTCGMMSRVSLGHTGRNIHAPPRWAGLVFAYIVVSAITRAIVPLVDMNHYMLWVVVSQYFWILGFSSFTVLYCPMWVSPRVDGQS